MADHVCKVWESLLSLLLEDDNQVNLFKPLEIAMWRIVVCFVLDVMAYEEKKAMDVPESKLVRVGTFLVEVVHVESLQRTMTLFLHKLFS